MRIGVERALVDGALVIGDIEVRDGLIVEVGIGSGTGKGIALPGFIDLHTHGFGGVDFARAGSDAISEATVKLTATGVTSLQPTIMSMSSDEMTGAVRRIDSASAGEGAHILGAHLEGPFLSTDHHGAHDPEMLVAPDQDLVERLMAAGRVSQVTLAPELPGAVDLIERLRATGVVVSLGHTGASTTESSKAFEAGATSVTHMFNAMAPFHHRRPGIVGSVLARSDVFVEVILDGFHLAEEAEILAVRVAGDWLVASTDAMAGAGLGDGVFRLGNREVTVENGAARLGDGTVASSVLTMDGAFRRLVSLGLDLAAASRATSGAAAEMVGRPELGALDAGSPADIVVLDEALNVAATYVAGRPVWERA